MNLAQVNLPQVYASQIKTMQANIVQTANQSPYTNFSDILNGVANSESASETHSDSLYECEVCENECPCEGEVEKDISEFSETEARGPAACEDCCVRKAGHCDGWNAKKDEESTDEDISKGSRKKQSHDLQDTRVFIDTDLLDYTNAIVNINRKKLRNNDFS